jgi:hypothetical protein
LNTFFVRLLTLLKSPSSSLFMTIKYITKMMCVRHLSKQVFVCSILLGYFAVTVAQPVGCGSGPLCTGGEFVCVMMISTLLIPTHAATVCSHGVCVCDALSINVQGTCVGSYISEDGLVNGTTVARNTSFVISALPSIGAAEIYYTIDGSIPSTNSLSGISPLTLTPANGTTLKWFAYYGAVVGREALTHSFTVVVDASQQINLGTITENVVFNSVGGPVITGVCPGATVTGSVSYTLWASNAAGYCPSCELQYVVGVDSVGVVACVNFGVAPSFPGRSGVATFSFTAPANASVYRLLAGFGLNFDCAGAGLTGSDVGLLAVSSETGCTTSATTTVAAATFTTSSIPPPPASTSMSLVIVSKAPIGECDCACVCSS